MIWRHRPAVRITKPVAVVTATVPITIATFYREMIRQLQNEGYDVCVVSSPGAELERVRREARVRTRSLKMTREISPAADSFAFVQWVWLLFLERPTLIISATPKASFLGLLAGKTARVKRRVYLMIGLRLEGDIGRRRQLLVYAERLTSWASTEIVANSSSLAARFAELRLAPKRELRQTWPGSSHGVDSIHFSPRPADLSLASQMGIDRTIPLIGFIGRLTHDKGIDFLIDAIALLHENGVDCQLLVVGAQNEPDSIVYLGKLKSLGERLFVVGAVEDVRPYFALMDVHVLPSLREGFPNVVLEASAMGVPTVTTDATGAIDSVRHGETGLMVKKMDTRGLAEAIKILICDRSCASRYGATARHWAVNSFQPESVVRTLLGFDNLRPTQSGPNDAIK